MQRTYTMELRVDFVSEDKDNKYEAIKIAFMQAGQHVFAKASFATESQKPQIAIHSNDFFCGTEEIALIGPVIQQGLDAIRAEGDIDDSASEPSAELLAAFAGVK